MNRTVPGLLFALLLLPHPGLRAEEAAPPAPLEVDASEFVGLRFRALPERYFGGWLVGPSGSGYGISHVEYRGRELLLLDKQLGRDAGGNPRWETVSALLLPEDGRDWVASGFDCSVNGKPDESVIASVVLSADLERATVKHAWRANLERRRIEPVPIAGISCEPGQD